jgi:hypothetical protein
MLYAFPLKSPGTAESVNKMEARQVLLNFNIKVSREKHKTSYRSLRISGMALSNQSDLGALFSPRRVNLKISHHILPNLNSSSG